LLERAGTHQQWGEGSSGKFFLNLKRQNWGGQKKVPTRVSPRARPRAGAQLPYISLLGKKGPVLRGRAAFEKTERPDKNSTVKIITGGHNRRGVEVMFKLTSTLTFGTSQRVVRKKGVRVLFSGGVGRGAGMGREKGARPGNNRRTYV